MPRRVTASVPLFTSFPIDSMIKSAGYGQTLVVWGIIQGVIGILAAQWLRVPPENYHVPGAAAAPLAAQQTRRSYSPREMLQNPVFYLLFLMMSMMSTSGLMVVSNVGPFAKEFGVADMLVLGMAALPLSLTLSRVTNGLTRPFFGWVSDHIGREATMALAFSLEAVAILILFAFINQPALFVVLTGLVFFGWGEIFSLFPSTLTDTFGPKYAATNYGFLYIAQGVGSILGGPAAAFLKQTTGKLDRRVHHCRRARRRHRATRHNRAAGDAAAALCQPIKPARPRRFDTAAVCT